MHPCAGGFENGIDTFENMARMGVAVVDRMVQEAMNGRVDLKEDARYIPRADYAVAPPESRP